MCADIILQAWNYIEHGIEAVYACYFNDVTEYIGAIYRVAQKK